MITQLTSRLCKTGSLNFSYYFYNFIQLKFTVLLNFNVVNYKFTMQKICVLFVLRLDHYCLKPFIYCSLNLNQLPQILIVLFFLASNGSLYLFIIKRVSLLSVAHNFVIATLYRSFIFISSKLYIEFQFAFTSFANCACNIEKKFQWLIVGVNKVD